MTWEQCMRDLSEAVERQALGLTHSAHPSTIEHWATCEHPWCEEMALRAGFMPGAVGHA